MPAVLMPLNCRRLEVASSDSILAAESPPDVSVAWHPSGGSSLQLEDALHLLGAQVVNRKHLHNSNTA